MATTEQLIKFIAAHGIKARVASNGHIEALGQYYSSGRGASSKWESIEPTARAVRNWLGY